MAQSRRAELIRLVERYFAAVDAARLDEVIALLAPDCVVEIPTSGRIHRGLDPEVRAMFERRVHQRVKAWHGHFHYAADEEALSVATHFQVRRESPDGKLITMHNCNFFEFDAQLRIRRITVWMTGTNTLE